MLGDSAEGALRSRSPLVLIVQRASPGNGSRSCCTSFLGHAQPQIRPARPENPKCARAHCRFGRTPQALTSHRRRNLVSAAYQSAHVPASGHRDRTDAPFLCNRVRSLSHLVGQSSIPQFSLFTRGVAGSRRRCTVHTARESHQSRRPDHCSQ